MSAGQSQLFPVLDQGLFSANFLHSKFLDFPIWQETPGAQARCTQALTGIRSLYDQAKRAGVFEARDEQKTEDKFIRPAFKALGWIYDPQPRHKRRQAKVRPDYALFATQTAYEEAARAPDNAIAYYSRAEAIGEAKYWGRPLNDQVKGDALDASDATAQLVRYLDEVYYHTDGRILWGILTNGKIWRLFSHRAASRSTNFYEVDLEALLLLNDPVQFRGFYGFFSREALTPHPRTGKRWVDLYLEESDRAAHAVSEHLKDLIFKNVFPRVAEGFLDYRRKENGTTPETDETLGTVFAGTMTLLFRFLFLLYAESRDLLPLRDELGYRKRSLQALKERVWEDLRRKVTFSTQSFDYWEHLVRVFRIVDRGNPDFNVPHYNGGLFHDPRKRSNAAAPEHLGTRFLAEHKLADPYLADALAALTFDPDAGLSERKFLDYSTLGVRHLGDVYEGLLEFHLNADASDGNVSLEKTSHERKESGSYFTPHFIVEFIVDKTIGPPLRTRLDDVEALLAKWGKAMDRCTKARSTDAIRAAQAEAKITGRAVFDCLFGLRVLDPTMGSGHFLVHTVDYLSDQIVTFLARHPRNPVIATITSLRNSLVSDLRAQGLDEQEIERITGRLTEINLIKRMVMKRCVYGVDLNPMAVELAKLSLWLDSFTLGAPLSFLDHHLKCGNTLVGARVETVEAELAPDLFGSRFAGMLQATELMREVGDLTDATVAEVEESETKYDHAREALGPFIRLLDLWEAEEFGIAGTRRLLVDPQGREEIEGFLRGKGRAGKHLPMFAQTTDVAARRRFFHWELEFPEVWYGQGRRLEDGGFDAVIGNPPWVRQETLAELKKVLARAFPDVYHGVADIYVYVLGRGLEVLKPGGRLGFILPNKWLRANYGEALRRELVTRYQPELLVDFGHAPLFPDADTFPVIAVARRSHDNDRQDSLNLEVCPVPREILGDLKLGLYVQKEKFEVPTLLLKPEGWTLEPPGVLKLFEKIKNSGTTLKEFAGDVPYRGVLTGLNEAFFIDQSTRDRLVAGDPKCEPLIKKLLRGRNIQRWAAEWEKEWIIALPSSHNRAWPWASLTDDLEKAEARFAKELPSLHAHFKPMEKALRKREDQGKFWWELRPCDYYDKFEAPKIIYQDIQFHSWFAYDSDGCYLNNTAYFLPTGDQYLLALLNSSLLWWFNWRYLPHGKDEALRAFTFLVELLPVQSPSPGSRAKIEEQVTHLIALAQSHAEKRAAFLQWVTHETGIDKLPTSLDSPWQLQPDAFLAALKKSGLERPSPAMLQHLTQTFEGEAAAMRANRVEALQLERELDDLILKVYQLTHEEIRLLRQTAPPRSPLTVLEECLHPSPKPANTIR